MELKSCPFCGGQPTWRKTKIKHCQSHGDPYQDHILLCAKPKCEISPMIQGNNKERLINTWNTRPTVNI